MANISPLKLAIVYSGQLQITIAKKARMDDSRLSKIVRGHVDATENERKNLARVLRKDEDELFPKAASA